MKKHILLLTGRDASSAVKEAADSAPLPVKVHVCNTDVASFLSPELVLDELSGLDLDDVSLIIVPGSVVGGLSELSKAFRIPCVKGPKHFSDLPQVLALLSKTDLRLSEETPADELLRKELRASIESELIRAYSSTDGSVLRIGDRKPVFLGTGVMHVIAEIPNAPKLSDPEVEKAAAYYVGSGASVLDLGMVYGADYSKEVPRLVDAVKSVVDVPVSIDSLNPNEIVSAVDSGIDLVLSLDQTNYEVAASMDIPAVVIPRDSKGVPQGVSERISLVESLIQRLEDIGFRKYIVDLVLDPPNLGLVNSLQIFHEFRAKHSKIPMMMGCGNVTELLDADSLGVNALLASIASELGVDLLFSTEASCKTKGAVGELSKAAKMMYLSKKRGQAPKDLGIDLLSLKDKRSPGILRNPGEAALKAIEAASVSDYGLEECSFSIYISGNIEVVFYRDDEPRLKFTGHRAEQIYKEIIFRGLVKSLYHAAYLGRELEKAEIALRTGKNYVQDEDLF
ncbi:MAG: dihydropteroate synthase-like protein [Candidatus Altiarchaeota archaeon]|nr:dihydropteroate synthase-like protein [Candidatus Altiarchaeota archaeon]